MFEDSLLIIKNDYLQKLKPILLKLLQKGFQIQGQRRLLFSPEDAAEFYGDYAERKEFMLLVIMLSKGTSEAFILARENCVEELMNAMVCYFGNSEEMVRNVHVSLSEDSVQREITFIFPNYIREPIPLFYEGKFSNSDLFKDMMIEAYDLVSGANCPPKRWKEKLAEWLTRSNSKLPQISNQCRGMSFKQSDEKSTLALPTARPTEPCAMIPETPPSSSQPLSISSVGSSMMTSSSCMTCSCFDGGETCHPPPKKADSLELIVRARTTKLDSSTPSGSADSEEEVVEWQEMVAEESHESEDMFEQVHEDGGILDEIRPLGVTGGVVDDGRSSQVKDQGKSVGATDGELDHITSEHLKTPEGQDQVEMPGVTDTTDGANLNEDKVPDAGDIESTKGSVTVVEDSTVVTNVENPTPSVVIIETQPVHESPTPTDPVVKVPSSSSSSVILVENVPSVVIVEDVTDEAPKEIPKPDESQPITVVEQPTEVIEQPAE